MKNFFKSNKKNTAIFINIILVTFFIKEFFLSFSGQSSANSSYFIMDMVGGVVTLAFLASIVSVLRILREKEYRKSVVVKIIPLLLVVFMIPILVLVLLLPFFVQYYEFDYGIIFMLLLVALNKLVTLLPYQQEKVINMLVYFFISMGSLVISFLPSLMGPVDTIETRLFAFWGITYFGITGILIPLFYKRKSEKDFSRVY